MGDARRRAELFADKQKLKEMAKSATVIEPPRDPAKTIMGCMMKIVMGDGSQHQVLLTPSLQNRFVEILLHMHGGRVPILRPRGPNDPPLPAPAGEGQKIGADSPAQPTPAASEPKAIILPFKKLADMLKRKASAKPDHGVGNPEPQQPPKT